MSKNKIIIFIMLVIAIVITLIYFEKPLLRMFKQKLNLNYNYNDIECIEIIRFTSDSIKIDNKMDIKKIIYYLNSIELIEEKTPNYKIKDRKDLYENFGYFMIHFNSGCDFRNVMCDVIIFTTDYLTVHNNGFDWEYTDYYIVDSGYNPKDQTSNFSDFLDEILIKYME